MKTDNVLIHIGYAKTGSTWLQENLFNNEKYFIDVSKEKNKQSSIAKLFYSDKNHNYLSCFDLNKKMIVDEFKKIIESKNKLNNNWYVISEERLAGAGVGSGYDSSIISNRIKTSFPDAKILIMIREQKSILLSYYFQLLDGGLHDSFKKLIEPKNRYSKPGFAFHFYDYNPLIKHYFELFGKENVLVLPFEMFTQHPNLFFKKLSSFLNMNINLSDFNVKKSANERSNYFILYYLRYFYTFSISTPLNAYLFYYQPKIRKILEIFFRSIPYLIPSFLNRYTKLKIKKEIERRVGNYYHESNKELEKLLETNLKEYGYYK